MISYEHLAFLREKIPLYLPSSFKNVGGKYNGRCPFCGDSKKSSTKKRGWCYFSTDCSYFCFNCGISMSGIKLLKALSGADYDSLYREYVRLFMKSGLDSSLSSTVWRPDVDEELSVFNVKRLLDPALKKPLSDRAKAYLEGRKVLEAPFLKETLFSTYSKDGKEEYILIPWKMNGVDAYYQVNDFLKFRQMKYMFPKGKKKLLYGIDNIDPSYKKIFAFEGVYDSLFVKNGIATGTKSITDYQMRLIKERWPHHEVVVSFDNDQPGFSATMKMIEKDTASKFFMWFNANTKEKDINDYVLARGDVNMFTDPAKLDAMTYDKLQMKLWLIKNGRWKKESKFKLQDSSKEEVNKRSVFISPQ